MAWTRTAAEITARFESHVEERGAVNVGAPRQDQYMNYVHALAGTATAVLDPDFGSAQSIVLIGFIFSGVALLMISTTVGWVLSGAWERRREPEQLDERADDPRAAF